MPGPPWACAELSHVRHFTLQDSDNLGEAQCPTPSLPPLPLPMHYSQGHGAGVTNSLKIPDSQTRKGCGLRPQIVTRISSLQLTRKSHLELQKKDTKGSASGPRPGVASWDGQGIRGGVWYESGGPPRFTPPTMAHTGPGGWTHHEPSPM